jgi:hypothetical protein
MLAIHSEFSSWISSWISSPVASTLGSPADVPSAATAAIAVRIARRARRLAVVVVVEFELEPAVRLRGFDLPRLSSSKDCGLWVPTGAELVAEVLPAGAPLDLQRSCCNAIRAADYDSLSAVATA